MGVLLLKGLIFLGGDFCGVRSKKPGDARRISPGCVEACQLDEVPRFDCRGINAGVVCSPGWGSPADRSSQASWIPNVRKLFFQVFFYAAGVCGGQGQSQCKSFFFEPFLSVKYVLQSWFRNSYQGI